MIDEKIKELLKVGFINNAYLASKMYPNVKNAKSKLHNKINNIKSGNGFQRLTDNDISLICETLKNINDKINDVLASKD